MVNGWFRSIGYSSVLNRSVQVSEIFLWASWRLLVIFGSPVSSCSCSMASAIRPSTIWLMLGNFFPLALYHYCPSQFTSQLLIWFRMVLTVMAEENLELGGRGLRLDWPRSTWACSLWSDGSFVRNRIISLMSTVIFPTFTKRWASLPLEFTYLLKNLSRVMHTMFSKASRRGHPLGSI